MYHLRLHTNEIIEVASLTSASKALVYLRDKSGVTASEFYSTEGVGQVTMGNKLVAVVSYNGRVWEPTPSGRAGQIEVLGV